MAGSRALEGPEIGSPPCRPNGRRRARGTLGCSAGRSDQSAIDRVELRAQVGGTLTEIHFQDGQIVHKGDLLFVIDPRPYEIRLAQAKAQLQTATARVALANSQLARAQSLRRNDFGTQETVDQRLNEQDAAKAAVEDAKARIRDARLDLEYCRVTA